MAGLRSFGLLAAAAASIVGFVYLVPAPPRPEAAKAKPEQRGPTIVPGAADLTDAERERYVALIRRSGLKCPFMELRSFKNGSEFACYETPDFNKPQTIWVYNIESSPSQTVKLKEVWKP